MTKQYTDSFLRFYKIYPKKKGKFEANKTWGKQKLDKMESDIINHVQLSLKYDTDWKLGRIPYASTYLNQHRYEDEISGCYREPETHTCVPVQKIPREPKVDTPEIKAIRAKIKEESRRISKHKLWAVPKERALMINLNYQLDQACNGPRKVGEILSKERKAGK